MMLNPVEQRLAQLRHGLPRLRRQIDIVQPLAREDARHLPAGLLDRAHSRLSAALAMNSSGLPEMKSGMVTERVPATRAALERRKVAAKLHGPEGEVR